MRSHPMQEMQMKTDFPILVIGAGASGMMAAYAATRARPSCAVILEKEARAGRKLLATGAGENEDA